MASFVYRMVTLLCLLSMVCTAPLQAQLRNEPVKPIPPAPNLDPKKVALGKALFHDTLLSHDRTLSCASCHAIENHGAAPGMAFSIPGVSGIAEPINIPTVFNSGLNFMQFWDGRADSLEAQIDGPLHNANEMGITWKEVIKRLRQHSEYRETFFSIYRSPPTEKAVKDAIATYERSLVTPNSPFDRYLKGEEDAISQTAKQGYLYFKKYGCASCHQGANLGGNMFQTFGIVKDYFKDRGDITHKDLGRFHVTGKEEDKHVFRVPSLRHVAETPPYFHDGSAATLEEAIQIMADYQLGRDLSKEEIEAIGEFLRSLSGTYEEILEPKNP